MPELPEVETVVKTLEKQIKNRTIKDVKILYSRIIESNSFKERLINQTFINFKRRGKFLIFELNDVTLIVHLRMEGKFFVENNDEIEKHTHVIFVLDNGYQLRYNDVRKFGRMWLYNKDEHYDCLDILGYEPWDKELTADYLLAKYQRLDNPIKTVLLDQSIIAGIGNIYANEICFASHLNPCTKAKLLNKEQCLEIINNTRIILEKAIAAGGTTIRSYTSSLKVTGRFQQSLNVHMQNECKFCHSKIEKVFLNGRSTYYCPKCQKSITKTIAITGNIGSGKSEVLKYLSKNYLVISVDEINDDILKNNKKIKKEFKEFYHDNLLDKELLSKEAFTNNEILNKLESLVYPLILDRIQKIVKATNDKYVFVEVPLLFEKNWDKYFDYSLLIMSSQNNIRERLLKIRHLDNEKIDRILNKQINDELKIKKADFIIENNKDLEYLYQNINLFLTKLN